MSNSAADYFTDPLDPPHSLQLNNRFWKNDSFNNLEILREAEDDLSRGRFAALKRSLKPVKALLPASLHRRFLSRLVYSMVYRVQFQPIRFSLKLSDAFVRANSYAGVETEAYQSATAVGELKYVTGLVHDIYRDQYGMDALSSDFAVRYANSKNAANVSRMTAHGEFSDFHLDEKKDFTAIIYLSSVNRDNGCFSYIEGTPMVRRSHLLRALHQVVDFDMGLAASAPEARAHLPLELRGSMRVGDYLDDEKQERLRAACVDVVGNVGDGIIFNGFDTVHRGGKPRVGERTALFISTRGYLNKRVKKAFYDQLAYLWL
jgi:hypothetical protein